MMRFGGCSKMHVACRSSRSTWARPPAPRRRASAPRARAAAGHHTRARSQRSAARAAPRPGWAAALTVAAPPRRAGPRRSLEHERQACGHEDDALADRARAPVQRARLVGEAARQRGCGNDAEPHLVRDQKAMAGQLRQSLEQQGVSRRSASASAPQSRLVSHSVRQSTKSTRLGERPRERRADAGLLDHAPIRRRLARCSSMRRCHLRIERVADGDQRHRTTALPRKLAGRRLLPERTPPKRSVFILRPRCAMRTAPSRRRSGRLRPESRSNKPAHASATRISPAWVTMTTATPAARRLLGAPPDPAHRHVRPQREGLGAPRSGTARGRRPTHRDSARGIESQLKPSQRPKSSSCKAPATSGTAGGSERLSELHCSVGAGLGDTRRARCKSCLGMRARTASTAGREAALLSSSRSSRP